MNKLTKVLSVFLLAGALGASVAGATACKTTKGHTHDYQYSVNATDSTKHDGHCSKDGCDKPDITEGHHWNDQDKCKECGTAKPTTTPTGEKLKIPATATKLLVEGVQTETIDLSTTKTSHDIPKDEIKVYFADASNTKIGDAIPAANYTLRLQDPAAATITTWTGLKTHGEYKVRINLKDCEMADDYTGNMEVADFIANVTVTVNNPIKSDSLKVKTGDGVLTTQKQTAVNSILPTWTYEVTRANGDKEDVPTADVFVSGLETTKVTDSGVANLKWGEITGTQAYTITVNEDVVVQSYALNFDMLTADQKTKIKTEDVSLQDDRFVIQVTKGEVANNATSYPEFAGKYFASRLKMGGKFDGDDAHRYVKVHVDGEATLTVYCYNNSDNKDGLVSVYNNWNIGAKPNDASKQQAYVEGDAIGSGKVNKGKTDDKENANFKFTYTLPEAGDYWILPEVRDICLTYIQIDQLVSKTGNQAVELGGEMQASELKLNTSGAKTVYKKDGTIDTTGITGEITLSNSVTCDKRTESIANGDLTFKTDDVDMTKLGKKTITVEYTPEGMDKVTATYSITVESAVDGVIGASAGLKNGFVNTVETADAKLTFKKSDIAVTVDWTKSAVEGLTPTYTVKSGETEIDDTTGMEFAIGSHTLTVEIIINDGTNSITLTEEVTLVVKKKLAPGEVENVKLVVDAAMVEAVGSTAITEAKPLAEGITLGIANKAGTSAMNLNDVEYSKYVQIAGTFKSSAIGEKTIKLEVAQAATIRVIYKSNADRKLNLYNSDGTVAQDGTDAPSGKEATYTVSAGGTFYLGSSNSSINIYEIEIIYS